MIPALFVPLSQTPSFAPHVWEPGPVTSQGSHPSCVGHALIAAIRSAPIGSYTTLSGDELYREAQAIDGLDDSVQGTTVVAGLRALAEDGWIDSWTSVDTFEGTLALLQEGPVVLETDWYQDETTVDGADHMHPTGPLQPFRHALMIYGQDGVDAYFQNSWGSAWAGDGRARMSLQELRFLFVTGHVFAWQPHKDTHRTPFKLRGVLFV